MLSSVRQPAEPKRDNPAFRWSNENCTEQLPQR